MENYFVLIVIMSTTMKNDMIKQIFYFASGLPVVYDGDPAQPVNNRLHTGKEYLSFEGLHWYDNHARMYDPLLMRFTTPDPLAAQFPSVSPYAYCNNSPVNFIDPDGRLVLFAPNVSETFKQEFSKAVKYMNKANTSGDLKYLNSIKEVYYIAETNSFNGRTGNRFEGETKTIYWNPYAAMKTFNNSLLSPVTMLVHELGHGANHHKNKKEYIQKLNTKNDDYDNLEEKRVIENIETDAAKKHGDIPQNQEKTREDHDGEYYKVEDPTINVNKNGSF